MTKNGVRDIIKQELNRAHMDYREIESKETESVYYKLHLGNSSMLFRISDHPTKKDVSTLRYDHKTSEDNVRRYTRNRIKDAKAREVGALLDSFCTERQKRRYGNK